MLNAKGIEMRHNRLMLLLLILIILIFVSVFCGCSFNQQRVASEDMYGNCQTMTVSKINFCYWSKFQADTITEPDGMIARVHDAEGRPEAEILLDLLMKGYGL